MESHLWWHRPVATAIMAASTGLLDNGLPDLVRWNIPGVFALDRDALTYGRKLTYDLHKRGNKMVRDAAVAVGEVPRRFRRSCPEAAAQYKACLAMEESHHARINRGLLLRAQGDLNGALAELNRAVDISPLSLHARAGRALVELELGLAHACAADASAALDSGLAEAVIANALAQSSQLRDGEPRPAPSEAEDLFVVAVVARGLARVLLQDLEGAMADADAAVAVAPNNSLAFAVRALAKLHAADFDGACADAFTAAAAEAEGDTMNAHAALKLFFSGGRKPEGGTVDRLNEMAVDSQRCCFPFCLYLSSLTLCYVGEHARAAQAAGRLLAAMGLGKGKEDGGADDNGGGSGGSGGGGGGGGGRASPLAIKDQGGSPSGSGGGRSPGAGSVDSVGGGGGGANQNQEDEKEESPVACEGWRRAPFAVAAALSARGLALSEAGKHRAGAADFDAALRHAPTDRCAQGNVAWARRHASRGRGAVSSAAARHAELREEAEQLALMYQGCGAVGRGQRGVSALASRMGAAVQAAGYMARMVNHARFLVERHMALRVALAADRDAVRTAVSHLRTAVHAWSGDEVGLTLKYATFFAVGTVPPAKTMDRALDRQLAVRDALELMRYATRSLEAFDLALTRARREYAQMLAMDAELRELNLRLFDEQDDYTSSESEDTEEAAAANPHEFLTLASGKKIRLGGSKKAAVDKEAHQEKLMRKRARAKEREKRRRLRDRPVSPATLRAANKELPMGAIDADTALEMQQHLACAVAFVARAIHHIAPGYGPSVSGTGVVKEGEDEEGGVGAEEEARLLLMSRGHEM